MKKLIILLIAITAYSSRSETVISIGYTAKVKEHKKLYKISCPAEENITVQPVKNCICKDNLSEEMPDYQYSYGAAMPVVGNYY